MSATPCAVCNQAGGARFDIAHFDRAGAQKFATTVCSIKCLVTWAYRYATMQGTMFAFQAKGAIASLRDFLKGGKQ